MCASKASNLLTCGSELRRQLPEGGHGSRQRVFAKVTRRRLPSLFRPLVANSKTKVAKFDMCV
jgi:hypothetical protein